MLLRRIIEHVKAQNWTAVGLDFVIVVVGVFMGIQLGNWNEARQEQERERAYLERLLADVELSIESTENIREFLTGYVDGYKLVVRTTQTCVLIDDEKDAFADALSDLGKVGPSVFTLSTMEEMLSAGHFSLIQNRDIRDTLNGLKRDAAYQAEIREALYTYISEMANFAGRRVIRIYDESKGPFEPILWNDVMVDFAALCEDHEFQAAVSHVRAMTDNMIDLNDRALATLRPARAALAKEVERVR